MKMEFNNGERWITPPNLEIASNCFKIQTPKPWSTRIDEENKCGWRFSSKLNKIQCEFLLTFKRRRNWALVNFVGWGDILQGILWLSKAWWMNEMRPLFIGFRLGNLVVWKIKIRLGIQIWREINNQVVISEGVWWELIKMR